MPDVLAHCRSGPVRVALLPLPRGTAAGPVACGWLASALACARADLAFARGAHGRPELDHGSFDCNWSHSGDRLAVALGEGVRVGIDIEVPRPRPRALELAARYFADEEALALADLPPAAREAAFLRLWCAKEAVLKAHGRGLAFGLDRLRFDRLHETPRLVAADAALGEVAGWHVEPLGFAGLVGTVAWRAP